MSLKRGEILFKGKRMSCGCMTALFLYHRVSSYIGVRLVYMYCVWANCMGRLVLEQALQIGGLALEPRTILVG